jgi:hypothetical protein
MKTPTRPANPKNHVYVPAKDTDVQATWLKHGWKKPKPREVPATQKDECFLGDKNFFGGKKND